MQPQASSLGNDELVYQYLKTLFGMKSLKKQIFQVCNDSLTSELAPSSWKDIHVRLLPKKGDLSKLKNWLRVSPINCDAKNFTYVFNMRLFNIVTSIINHSQKCFVRWRFISDHGFIFHLLAQQASWRWSHLGSRKSIRSCESSILGSSTSSFA